MSQGTLYQWMVEIAHRLPTLGKWQVKGLPGRHRGRTQRVDESGRKARSGRQGGQSGTTVPTLAEQSTDRYGSLLAGVDPLDGERV